MSAKSYDYSTTHRILEILSILGLAVGVGFIFYEMWFGLGNFSDQAWWIVPSSIIAAYLAADFVSGVVHFLGDTFGDETTPLLGEAFIKPFREHHVDPRGITRHDFIETNGNNCLVSVPAALLIYFLMPTRVELWALWTSSFWVWLLIGVFMTNQFHKWSHLEEPPAWIALLQKSRLILNPEHHDIHHTVPFDKYYCITTGWLNPLLNSLRFFRISESVLRWVFRAPKTPASSSEPAG